MLAPATHVLHTPGHNHCKSLTFHCNLNKLPTLVMQQDPPGRPVPGCEPSPCGPVRAVSRAHHTAEDLVGAFPPSQPPAAQTQQCHFSALGETGDHCLKLRSLIFSVTPETAPPLLETCVPAPQTFELLLLCSYVQAELRFLLLSSTE